MIDRDKKKLWSKPHRIRGREDAWWYEENGGIAVVVERRGAPGTTVVDIPWRAIRAALGRKDAD